MRRERNLPLTTVDSLITAAWPRHAQKEIERQLGCSTRQAWRIVHVGKVPGKFRQALIELLDRQITKNRLALEAIQEELKGIAHAEMVARAEGRRAPDLGSDA